MEPTAAIAGYSVLNDVSMRDWQNRTLQFLQGKTFESSTPLGPWLVTPDEPGAVPGPEQSIGCSVDGEVMQDSTTADLLFDVPHLVSYLSTVMTLLPGDVIATGTPSGVGAGRKPPRFLADWPGRRDDDLRGGRAPQPLPRRAGVGDGDARLVRVRDVPLAHRRHHGVPRRLHRPGRRRARDRADGRRRRRVRLDRRRPLPLRPPLGRRADHRPHRRHDDRQLRVGAPDGGGRHRLRPPDPRRRRRDGAPVRRRDGVGAAEPAQLRVVARRDGAERRGVPRRPRRHVAGAAGADGQPRPALRVARRRDDGPPP